MNDTLVHFGAGNIGRSFIGALFSRAGYEVVFVDVADTVVDALNQRHGYTVVVKHPDGRDEELPIHGVRAVHGADTDAAVEALSRARFASTAVGKGALRHVVPTLAAALKRRHEDGTGALDVILAENARDAAEMVRSGLAEQLGRPDWLPDQVGMVETSIGKMVPIMPAEVARRDPLLVYAEPYNTLIVDRHGFKTALPHVPEIHPVDNIQAYVDRKLFIHNLGHAATAYLAHRLRPELLHIWEAVKDPSILSQARLAMEQAAAALNREYPHDLAPADLETHIADLLRRFGNESLGDTVFRVGRDLYRKLARDDRLVGAMLLCARHALPFDAIARTYVAALGFAAPDGSGSLFAPDQEFHHHRVRADVELEWALTSVSGLDPDLPLDARVMSAVSEID